MKTIYLFISIICANLSLSYVWFEFIDSSQLPKSSRIETFTFTNNGIETKGKIFLPDSYALNKRLPAIYLIDFTEQHFKIATDEFEKVIDGVKQIDGLDALVVSLENIPDIDAEPESFQDHYEIYMNMASFVSNKYTNNTSRTFIGKGSEGGLVLMALFDKNPKNSLFDNFIVTDPSPKYTQAVIDLIKYEKFHGIDESKKLHFSFSTSNNRKKCNELINAINEAKLPWLQFKSKEYTTSNYENTYPISFAEGLEYIYN